jgi:sugar O-acyltransferase (sialic acid O-acetyltransferase NeuD family)
MMNKPLILIGGGGHCKSVIEAAESAGYSIMGVLDMPEDFGKKILNTTVIGTDDDIPSLIDKAEFIITVGFIKDPSIRIKIFNRIKSFGGKLATIIASTANVSHYATIGEGTVVLHHATINAGAHIGDNCIINTASNIEHDVVIGAQTHISTGAMINGDCKIGERVFIGSRTVACQGINVADDCIIGAGTTICKSLIRSGLYIGSPARLINK